MELLATLDEQTFQPPKSRIGSASNAYNYVTRLSDADQSRAIIRTRVKGNIDGNAPHSSAKLKALGMGDRTNLNFRQAQAIINQFKTPYYDLVHEVPMLADIRTAFGNSSDISEWSQIISEEYHRLVTSWEDWDFNLQFSQIQMLIQGIGPMFFPDNVDWRPDCGKSGHILVADGVRAKVSELAAMVILKAYTSPDLYAEIRNPRVAHDLGWNVHGVEKAIIDAHFNNNQQPELLTEQYEWYQEQFKNADLYYGDNNESVRTGHVLVKEFPEENETSGMISHHIVRVDQSSTEYLFSKEKRFDSMNDVIVPFFYDIGDGTWHSINGIGKEIYAYCKVFDMLRGREVDGAMIASSTLLQQKDSSSVTKASILQINNLSILPPGLALVPNAMGQNIDAVTGVRRDMETSLGNNIGSMYKAPNSPNPRKGQKQAIMEMQQSANLGKGNINRYYTQLDHLHQQMFRRASSPKLKRGMPGADLALAFQARCVQRGVPIQALQQIDSVKAYRSVGAGSAANRIMITDWLMEHAGSFPEEGRQEAIRMAISTLAGTQIMHAIMGDTKEPEKNNDSWEATMENGMLRNGTMNAKQLEDLITKEQSNVVHLEIHLGDAEDHVKEVEDQAQQQGMQMGALQSLFGHLDSAGIHCHFHLEDIKNDPIREDDYKELFKRWQKLSRIQDKVKQQLEEMQQKAQQEQAKQAQPDADFLKLINYKDSPESVKAQIEQVAGVPRQQGDSSVAEQNTQLKAASVKLKASKQAQGMVLDDVDTKLKVEAHQKDMQEPASTPAA